MTTETSASRLWSELETLPISLGLTPSSAATAAVSTSGGARVAFAELLTLLVTVKVALSRERARRRLAS